MKYISILLFILILLCSCTVSCTPAQTNSDASSESASAYIENKGSDTMVNLALAWAEEYQNVKPNVRISVTGGGSGTGISALMNHTVDIANASRAIKPEEMTEAAKLGFTPIEYVVARDAIAVIVNPSNRVDKLTLEQISKIYSGEITNWKTLGGEDRPIVKLSRETNSGTHVYFLETVIRLGNSDDKTLFSTDTLLLPSSEGIIAEVRDNPNAIGYDGLGYITDDVKVLAVAKDNDTSYVLPSANTVSDGTYPVARDLFVYTYNEPEGEIKIYLEWIFSEQAQAIVKNLGFVPVVNSQ